MIDAKKKLINRLQKDILIWQGFKPASISGDVVGLGPIEAAFPNGVFPRGVIHEFLSPVLEDSAASGGFIAGLLSVLMEHGGASLWIGLSGSMFPPALKSFGVEPDRVIFVEAKRDKDVLWVLEEGLKCEGFAAVIGELNEISFADSRRLQLVVEKSKVTGFVLRSNSQMRGATACTVRWRITPIPSETEKGMPGLGFPRWNVELLKVKNGHTGSWQIEWSADRFTAIEEVNALEVPNNHLKVG